MIFVASMILVLLGKFVPAMHVLFDNAYVIGSIGAGLAYYIYLKVKKIA